MEQMVSAIQKELLESKPFFEDRTVETIYFGGGTPSVIRREHHLQLLQTIQDHYNVGPSAEITIEANPDDIQKSDTVQHLHKAGFNRLSLGIQSFNDPALMKMNRAHTSAMTWQSLDLIRNSDFSNFSIDLIYSLPFLSIAEFEEDLQRILSIQAPHVSTYSLTVEDRTVFGHLYSKGKLKELDEESSAKEYEIILEKLTEAGYRNYEISNFGMPGYESRHNMNYWDYKPYLGVGPGAHSFDGKHRWSNIRNNALYIKGINKGTPPREFIELSPAERVNEYILTSLRTDTGIPLKKLQQMHALDLLDTQSEKIEQLISNELLVWDREHLCLSKKGKLLADQIAMDLFID